MNTVGGGSGSREVATIVEKGIAYMLMLSFLIALAIAVFVPPSVVLFVAKEKGEGEMASSR